MRTKILHFSMLALVSGCNTLPDLPQDEPASIVKLANIIECEILTTFAQASTDNRVDFKDWAATYTITQNATETDAAGLNPITWLAPVGVDKLLYSARADLEREAYRNGKAEYSVFVAEKNSQACERAQETSDIKVNPNDFKLQEWVSQISAANQLQLSNFSYSVRVQVTTDVGAGPTFENGKWTAVGGVSRKRITVKTVDFAFAPIPSKPKPLQVVVVAPIPEKSAVSPQYVPRKRKIVTQPAAAIVPDSVIRENRSIIQGQQLDRVSPNGVLDR